MTTNTETNALTAEAVESLTNRDEYGGWGYLGHPRRTRATDESLIAAGINRKLTADDVFLWANSRPARHYMDSADLTAADLAYHFAAELDRWLPVLRAELED